MIWLNSGEAVDEEPSERVESKADHFGKEQRQIAVVININQ